MFEATFNDKGLRLCGEAEGLVSMYTLVVKFVELMNVSSYEFFDDVVSGVDIGKVFE